MSALNEETFQPPPPPSSESKPRGPRASKLMPIGIGIAVLGVIILIGGIAKMIPGGISTGGAVCFLGVLLVIFSFIRLPDILETERPLSLLEKATGVFYEPSRVFRNLREHPNWIGAFVIIAVLTAVYSFAFVRRITPERIVDHTTQKLAEMGPPFAPPPERLDQMRTQQLQSLKNPTERAGSVIKSFVGIFVASCILAGLSLLGILAFGGRINFWQALAVTFYSALPVVVIQKLLGLAILYLKAPEDLHPILNQETTLQDNLGILLSPAAHPVLFVIASFIGLTSFYGLWLRAKGLHLGATKVKKGAAWSVAITLWVLILLLVSIFTALFPGFIS
jgi:Yip1 domain